MPKSVALYLLLAAAILIFLSTSSSPHSQTANSKHRRHRRLSHHPAAHHVAFDPFVAQLEDRGLLDAEASRYALDAAWERLDWGKMAEEAALLGEYFGEEGRLNLTQRLSYLFPLLDRFPRDGGITRHELEVWLQRQAVDRLFRRAVRHLKLHDRDGDGEVTLQEFLSYDPEQEIDWNNTESGKPGWWKEQFSNADLDGNGSLNAIEFNDLLHPEDSFRPNIVLWLLKEKLKEFDQNKDGKLDLNEFSDKAFEVYRVYSAYEDIEEGQLQQVNAEEEFRKLDVNNDKFLGAEELKPIIHLLYPGELSQSSNYAKYLMRKADDNGDDKLTLEEILQHQQAFYTTVYDDSDEDDDYYDDYDYHGELRR